MKTLTLDTLPELYRTAFTRDASAQLEERPLHFNVVRAGTLGLPTGQIVVCDPLVGTERTAFVQSVLPGRYPVDLSLGSDPQDKSEHIVFARILFARTEPAMWIKGLQPQDDAGEQGERFGVVAASGTVGIMDERFASQFKPQSLQQLDHFLDDLVANYKPRRSWLARAVDGENNAIFLTASRKDRLVRTFFAVDDEGDVCLALSSLLL